MLGGVRVRIRGWGCYHARNWDRLGGRGKRVIWVGEEEEGEQGAREGAAGRRWKEVNRGLGRDGGSGESERSRSGLGR